MKHAKSPAVDDSGVVAADSGKHLRQGVSFDLEEDAAIGFGDLTDAERQVTEEHQAVLAALAAKVAAGKHTPKDGQDDSGKADAPGEDAPELPASHEAEPAGKHAASNEDRAEGEGFLRRLALRADERSGGRLYAHKWQVAAGLAIVGIVVIGLPLGFAAGWGAASGGSASSSAASEDSLQEEVLTADQELREANVAARYEELGIDLSEVDRVPADQIQPITVDPVAVQPTAELQRIAEVDVSEGTGIQIDVPIVNQLDTSDGGRYLMAGCEVASLAMMLRHSGVEVTKEELQDAMPTVPIVGEDGLNGNPNRAFVGNMGGDYHGAGYSVYHAPVAELAQHYLLNQPFKVVDLTGQSFTVLLKELACGNPCWVITTTSMQPDLRAETWETAEGPLVINWALHSVLVTGYDDENIYLNDPYGYVQNVPYSREGFEQAWKLMGSQAVTVVPVQ